MSEATADTTSANPFAPVTQQVTVGDELLTVAEFTTGQVFDVLAQLTDITDAITAAGGQVSVPQLLASNGAALLAVIALACGRDVAWVRALRPIDTLRIATAILTVNASFFGQAAILLGLPKAPAA